jgi:GNAT superfamily N-acetyltransferase
VNITIGVADPERDYPRAAEILQTFERQSVTADTLKEWDAETQPGTIRRRCVGVDENGTIVGYSAVVHNSWMADGMFILSVVTDPPGRKQGIGTQLYDEAQDFAFAHCGRTLTTEVLDSDAESLRFAEKRGFKLWRHLFESVRDLRLSTFDERPFAGIIETLQAQGIRFFSLADAGSTTGALRKLWAVNYQAALDDPASSGTFPGFEEFQHIVTNGAWFRPEGQLLAAEGEKYVGLSAVGYFADSNSAYNMMTGVLPDYRGRKIAQALKLLTIRVAKSWDADYIRTNNDSQNAPMLAINRKLGYVPQPGLYRLMKTIEG